MALTISGTSNGKLGNLSLSASTGNILDDKNTTFFGVDMWRLTTNFTVTGSSLATATKVYNWERNDTAGFAKIGSGLTESSGIFSFPSTGIYLITSSGVWGTVANNFQTTSIETTQDNSTYTEQCVSHCFNQTSDYSSQTCKHIFDVTDTSLCKFKITALRDYANNNLIGNTTFTYTYVLVQKLGET
jgi:hypothetical protein